MHLIISIFSKPEQSQGRLFNRSPIQLRIKLGAWFNFQPILSKYIIGFGFGLKRGRKIRAAFYNSFCYGIPTSRLISQIVVRQQKILIFHSRYIPERQDFFFHGLSKHIHYLQLFTNSSEINDTKGWSQKNEAA